MLTHASDRRFAACLGAAVISTLFAGGCTPRAGVGHPQQRVQWQPAGPALTTAAPAGSATQTADPSAQAAAQLIPTGDEVLVRDNAWLHAPHNLKIRFRYKAMTAPLAAHEVHRFEVVQDRGDWLILALGKRDGWPSRACTYPIMSMRDHRGLSFAVKRAALAPVTSRHAEMRFDDGTDIRIPPGVPLGEKRASDGWYALGGRQLAIYVPLSDGVIGLSYNGWGTKREKPPKLPLRLKEHAKLRYAHTQQLPREARYHVYGLTPASDDGPTSKSHIADIRTACYRGHFRVGAYQVEEKPAGEGGGLGVLSGLSSVATWFKVATNSPVLWSDGVVAGTVARGFSTTSLKREGDRYCGSNRIGGYGPEEERTLQLCYPASHVSKRKADPLRDVLKGAPPAAASDATKK